MYTVRYKTIPVYSTVQTMPAAAEEKESEEGKSTNPTEDQEAPTARVDLSLLETWINDQDDDGNPSFESRLRRLQRTKLQKLTSREAVQKRLATFRPLTYFCKPAALSPLVCARFGYVLSSECNVERRKQE